MKWTCMKCGLRVDDRRVPNNCNNVKGQTHKWRDNDIPFIIDNGKTLTDITGWFKDSSGQLVSKKNKIPQSIDTGYGDKPYYDTIKNINVSSIIFKEIEYTILSISWELTKTPYVGVSDRIQYFIFTGNNVLVVDLKPNVKTRIDLNFYTVSELVAGRGRTMQDCITYALNNPSGVGSDLSQYGKIGHNGKKNETKPPLELYTYFDQEKKVIRFLFQFSEKAGHRGTSTVIEDIPDDFYFETSCDNFFQIFSIKR